MAHGSIPISDHPPRRSAGPCYKVRLTTLRTRAMRNHVAPSLVQQRLHNHKES